VEVSHGSLARVRVLTLPLVGAQILVLGKLMQPALLSWAAYRDQNVFRQRSGMEQSLLISEPRTGTQVRRTSCHSICPAPVSQSVPARFHHAIGTCG